MAIPLQQASAGSAGDVASLDITLPNALTPGNLCVLGAQRRGLGGFGPGAGWTEIWDRQAVSFGQSGLWYRVVQPGDSQTTTLTLTSNNGTVAAWLAEWPLQSANFETWDFDDTTAAPSSFQLGPTSVPSNGAALFIAHIGVRLGTDQAQNFSFDNGFQYLGEDYATGASALSIAWSAKSVPSSEFAETLASWQNAGRCGGGVAIFNGKVASAPEPDPPPERVHLLTAPKPARGIWLPVAGEEVATESGGTGRITLFTDDFNRADENPIASPWQSQRFGGTNTLQLIDNAVSSTGTSTATAFVDPAGVNFPQAQWSQAEIVGYQSNRWAGVTVCSDGVDALRRGYWFRVDADEAEINRQDGNSTATLASRADLNPGMGSILRLECEGGTLRAYLDDVEVLTATDSTYNGGYPGVLSSRPNAGNMGNFEAGEFGEAVATESAPTWLYVPPAPEGPAQVTPDAVNQPTELTVPTVDVHVPVTPDDLTQASTLSIPTVARDTDVATDNLTQTNVLTEPTITRYVAVSPADLTQANVVTSPEVQLTVFVDPVSHGQTLSEPAVKKVAVAADVEQITELSQPTARVNVTPVFIGPNISDRNETTGVPVGPLDPQPLFTLDPVKPQTWSVATGVLPPGLSIDTSTGLVSGTPTTAGDYNGISIQVAQDTGAGGATETAVSNTFNWIISDPGPSTGEISQTSIAIHIGVSL